MSQIILQLKCLKKKTTTEKSDEKETDAANSWLPLLERRPKCKVASRENIVIQYLIHAAKY